MTDKIALIKAEIERLENNLWLDDRHDQGVSDGLHAISKFINSLPEEPVSEDFESALAKEWQGYNDRGAAKVDALEDNTQELSFAKGFYRGAKWQKQNTINKACEWLHRNIDSSMWLMNFRKYMEDDV